MCLKSTEELGPVVSIFLLMLVDRLPQYANVACLNENGYVLLSGPKSHKIKLSRKSMSSLTTNFSPSENDKLLV